MARLDLYSLEAHRACKLFPLMVKYEIDKLVEDIRRNGQKVPITVLKEDDKHWVLDGRNRLKALKVLGRVPQYDVETDVESPVSLVMTLNYQRRHLTTSQRAMIAVDFVPLFQKEAEARQKAGKRVSRDEAEWRGEAVEFAASIANVGARTVYRAQRLKNPDPKEGLDLRLARRLARQVRDDPKFSIGAALDLLKRTKLQEQDPPTPDGKYGTIVLDPPWASDADPRMGAERHFPTMSTLDEIAEYAKVREWAAKDCMLFLWVTMKILPDAFELLDTWGFDYKSLLTWKKPRAVPTHWFHIDCEHVIFAVRGKPRPKVRNATTFFTGPPRQRVHSSKPEAFYELVERFSSGPYLSIFDRGSRKSWRFLGNEADADSA